jgi:hypothetical protein
LQRLLVTARRGRQIAGAVMGQPGGQHLVRSRGHHRKQDWGTRQGVPQSAMSCKRSSPRWPDQKASSILPETLRGAPGAAYSTPVCT